MRSLHTLLIAVGALISTATAGIAETRVALVVGNGAYVHTAKLANPLNDARDMAAALRRAGFEVLETIDADKRKLDDALRGFADRLANADIALFFYAGHGLQVGAQNYLIPTDAKLGRERDLEFEAVKLDVVLRQMEIDREGKTTIVILDACRDNPLARNLAGSMGTRSTAIGRGLAAAATGLGTFIAYSTQPGNVALDGDGRNSPFAAALVKHMGTTGRNLPATMIEVRKEVVAATGGRQVPWDHSALTGDFFFMPGATRPANTGAGADVAALQARLQKLEADARKRDAAAGNAARPAPPPTQPWPAANAPAVAVPAITPKAAPLQRVSPNFEEVENVGLMGAEIAEPFRAPSPQACRQACEQNPACVGFQHGRRSPMMGMCELFSRIDARREDPTWRSGLRKSAGVGTKATASIPPELHGLTPNRNDRGFAVFDGWGISSDDLIKTSNADSSGSCAVVCQNTPGCTAATYFDIYRGTLNACFVFSRASKAQATGPGISALIKSP